MNVSPSLLTLFKLVVTSTSQSSEFHEHIVHAKKYQKYNCINNRRKMTLIQLYAHEVAKLDTLKCANQLSSTEGKAGRNKSETPMTNYGFVSMREWMLPAMVWNYKHWTKPWVFCHYV